MKNKILWTITGIALMIFLVCIGCIENGNVIACIIGASLSLGWLTLFSIANDSDEEWS